MSWKFPFLSGANLVAISAAIIAIAPVRAAEDAPSAKAGRPNIIVIVADDLGYADVGFQGCKDIPTPNIDSLAKNGVRCTNGYVSCPVCSPTRAGLMTGRYQQRFGHEFNPGAPAQMSVKFGLPLDQVTLPQRLKESGYITGMVGKWHLGMDPQFHPLKRGFNSYFGFLHGAHSYIDPLGDKKDPIQRDREPVDEKEYLTDALTREAAAFVDAHHKEKEPFFLYLTFNAVHSPLQARQKYLERFSAISDQKRRTYAAMLSAMDDGIGAVLGKLREGGIEENTLIFFISDNGGPPQSNSSRNDPLRGTKAQVWEGGIRVPYVLQWKGVLPAGKRFDEPVISLDIFPTAVAAAGGTVPDDRPMDGVNLLPYLSGKKSGAPHEALFWRFGQQAAVRGGNWKLVKIGSDPPQLFDLAADISEEKDLAAEKPDKVKQLNNTFDKWNSQLVDPLWGTARNLPPKAKKAQRAG